jgi:hypothetical protein
MHQRDSAVVGTKNDPYPPKIVVKRFEMQPECLHDMHDHDEAPSRWGFYHVPKGQYIKKDTAPGY